MNDDEYPEDYFGNDEFEGGLLLRLMVILANNSEARELFFSGVLATNEPLDVIGPIIKKLIKKSDEVEYERMKEYDDTELDKYK